MKHRGDIYPTHGIGPDCQVLNIHRGDRMEYLVAMDTKPCNGPKVVKRLMNQECTDFQNGDQTSTLIRTVNGKTMLIQHDVLTPRPYSRMYQVVGSDGYASKYPVRQLLFRAAAPAGDMLSPAGCPRQKWRLGPRHSALGLGSRGPDAVQS